MAWELLFREFNDLASKPLSANIRFLAHGHARTIYLPRAKERSEFISELSELAHQFAMTPNDFHRKPYRTRDSIEIDDFTGFRTLEKYCRSIEYSVPPNGHDGWLSSFQFQTLWSVHADIDAIVQAKSQKSKADWLVIFEWYAPGALPPNDMLQPIQPSVFQRVFMLDPAIPGRLLEWMSSRWETPRAFEGYDWGGEIAYVDRFLEERSIPVIGALPALGNARA